MLKTEEDHQSVSSENIMRLLTYRTCKIIGLGSVGAEVVDHIVNNGERLFAYYQKLKDESGAMYIPHEVNTVEELSMHLKQPHVDNYQQFNFIIADVNDNRAVALFEKVATMMIDCNLSSEIVTTIGIVLNLDQKDIPNCVYSSTNVTIEVCRTDVSLYNGLYRELMAIPIGVLYNTSNVLSWISIDYSDVRYHLDEVKLLRVAFADLDSISEKHIMHLKQCYLTSNSTISYFYFDNVHTLDYIGGTTDLFLTDIPKYRDKNHLLQIVQGGINSPTGIFMLYQPVATYTTT